MVKLRRVGFTLVELAITVTIASILVCMTMSLMVATANFGNLLRYRVEATREARIVMRDMTGILRFGTGAVITVDDAACQSVKVLIEDHHLDPIRVPANSEVTYSRTKSNNELRRILSAGGVTSSDILLSSNVSDFQTTGAWNSTKRELTLKLKFTVNGATVPIESSVKFLGDQ